MSASTTLTTGSSKSTSTATPPAPHTPPPRFSVVVIHTPRGVIGRNDAVPFERPADMARFVGLTRRLCRPGMVNAVIMGRNTWTSLGGRALPGRLNCVVTSAVAPFADPNAAKFCTLDDALRAMHAHPQVDRVFVIGGGQLYAECFTDEYVSSVDYVFASEYVMQDDDLDDLPGDVKVDMVWTSHPAFRLLYEDKCDGDDVIVRTWGNASRLDTPRTTTPDPCVNYPAKHDELRYLRLVQSIISTGVAAPDRTGVGTFSQFSVQLRFDLSGGTMPLLTTKRVFWRGVMEELLWFISGSTDAADLSSRGVHIWDANARAHGKGTDLGPVYGHQWRHFGRPHGEDAGGVDQLLGVIDSIRTDPHSRRHVVSAWNPVDIPAMALPPCHMAFQFYVRAGELSCVMTQRSADVGLGLPFNIASYALLTHLVAHCCDLTARELVINAADVHVYRNHEGALLEQCSRRPRPFPKVIFRDDTPKGIVDIRSDHIQLSGYTHDCALKMDMAV